MADLILPEIKDLPESVLAPTDTTTCVCITYKRILGYAKSNKGETVPDYGGALAFYPRELGFALDKARLLPSLK